MTERTDRELLELAAKAAGIQVHRGIQHQSEMLFRSIGSVDGRFSGIEWNPLEDDGDALRLAVKLDIEVEPVPFGGRAIVRDDDDYGEQFDEESSDRMAATRRAIVRAAAAMAEGGSDS